MDSDCAWAELVAEMESPVPIQEPDPIPAYDFRKHGVGPAAAVDGDGIVHVVYADVYYDEDGGPEGETIVVDRGGIYGTFDVDTWSEEAVPPVEPLGIALTPDGGADALGYFWEPRPLCYASRANR